MTTRGGVNEGNACGWSVNERGNYWHGGSLPGLSSLLVRDGRRLLLGGVREHPWEGNRAGTGWADVEVSARVGHSWEYAFGEGALRPALKRIEEGREL